MNVFLIICCALFSLSLVIIISILVYFGVFFVSEYLCPFLLYFISILGCFAYHRPFLVVSFCWLLLLVASIDFNPAMFFLLALYGDHRLIHSLLNRRSCYFLCFYFLSVFLLFFQLSSSVGCLFIIFLFYMSYSSLNLLFQYRTVKQHAYFFLLYFVAYSSVFSCADAIIFAASLYFRCLLLSYLFIF